MPDKRKMSFLQRITVRVSEVLGREIEALIDAVKTIGFYSTVGLLVGLTLVIWSKKGYLGKPEAPAALIVEHLGLGLIVSSIAVFFYEYKAHTKKALDLAGRLEKLLLARGKNALDLALDELIGSDESRLPEGAKDVSSSCCTTIMAISALLTHDTRVNQQYVRIVSGLLKTVVKKNAESFTKLSRGDMAEFSVPANAAEMASDVLAAQMLAMEEDDKYNVVSDLLSWRPGQLVNFASATKQAVETGVQVRRIFNLFRKENEELDVVEVRRALESHLKSAANWKNKEGVPGYKVRIFGVQEKRRSRDEDFTEDKLEKSHFGIFVLGEEVFNFWVEEPDLSRIRITRDPDDIREDSEFFERLWDASSELSQDAIERICQDLKKHTREEKAKKNNKRRR